MLVICVDIIFNEILHHFKGRSKCEMVLIGKSLRRDGEQWLCFEQQLPLQFWGPCWCPAFQFLLLVSVCGTPDAGEIINK